MVIRPALALSDICALLAHNLAAISIHLAAVAIRVLPLIAAGLEYRSPGALSRDKLLSTPVAVSFGQSLTLWRGVLCLVGVGTMRSAYSSNEGLVRSMGFNKKMVPMAVEYRFHQCALLAARPRSCLVPGPVVP